MGIKDNETADKAVKKQEVFQEGTWTTIWQLGEPETTNDKESKLQNIQLHIK